MHPFTARGNIVQIRLARTYHARYGRMALVRIRGFTGRESPSTLKKNVLEYYFEALKLTATTRRSIPDNSCRLSSFLRSFSRM